MNHKQLELAAQEVLRKNDQGKWTIPSRGVYIHQWLWDSCFIAMGLATHNPERAAVELMSLLRGQWHNGMIPHMIFTPQPFRPDDARLWKSYKFPGTPENVFTSGITQPPVIAEAAAKVAKSLTPTKREKFLDQMVPALIRHHSWLYRERDIDETGLVLLFHPWESGMDNSPSWTEELKGIHKPAWLKVETALHLGRLVSKFRSDKNINYNERIRITEALALFHAANALVKRGYDSKKIIASPHFAVESLSFNSILIRNNGVLVDLAKEAKVEIPQWLKDRMKVAEEVLDDFCWDPMQQLYSHRTYSTMKCIAVPTVSSFFPLYAGVISKDRAEQLVETMTSFKYWTQYPLPTVPVDSELYEERRFWRGPTWVNSNWLVIQGLRNYNYNKEADELKQKTLDMVAKSGMYEYFSAKTGEGLGAPDFSWTAALVLDLLAES